MAYNIQVFRKDEEDFFGARLESIPEGAGSEFLEYAFGYNPLPDDSDTLLGYLDMASTALRGQESMVGDFASELLKRLGFSANGRLVRTHHSIPLLISGEYKYAQTDVCVITRRMQLLLLVQEHKRMLSMNDPEPQVIAEAIAAYQENNVTRMRCGLDTLDRMVIPCITIVGTFPRFYLVPVTKDLHNCVIGAQYPTDVTEVVRFTPVVSRQSDGMRPVADRRRILQCYEGFKKFVNELESSLKQTEEDTSGALDIPR